MYILAKYYVPKTGTRPGFPRVPYPLVTHMDRFAQKIGGSRLPDSTLLRLSLIHI